MRKIHIVIILYLILSISSCLHGCHEDKDGFPIKEKKRIFKKIGADNVHIEEIHKEYYVEKNGKQSAVVIGYVVCSKRTAALYISENTSLKGERTFPIDDETTLQLLDDVIRKLKRYETHHDTLIVELCMKTFGAASLNFAKNYRETKRMDMLFQQPLFCKIRDVLKENGYEIYDVSKNDFYPIAASEIRSFHILPDTCSQNSMGIDGMVVLKCKSSLVIRPFVTEQYE